MEAPARRRVVVVGGGVTGLSAAHRLVELRRERELPLEVELLEAGVRLGGVVATVRRQGFLMEEGPDSILTEKPWAIDLARRLGLERRIVGTRPEFRRSFVAFRGALHPTPDGFYLLAPADLRALASSGLFSLPGKVRMAMDVAIPRRRSRGDESLGAFVRRRLGREALVRIAQPMVAGIYGADPERLSLQATFPRFHEMEERYGSVIRALRAAARTRRAAAGGEGGTVSGARYSLFASFDGGLQVLTDALAARLPPGAARTGAVVDAIYPDPRGGWRLRRRGTDEAADALILAVPARAAAEMVGPFDARLGQKLGAIRYGSAATVSLAYREEEVTHPMDGVGFVVPAVEGRAVIGCTFVHRKYAGRAPDGQALLRAFHGAAALDLSDHDLVDRTHRELSGWLGLRGRPALSHVARWPDSMPHFEVGHLDRIGEIAEALRAHPGLALAGNGYRGIGIPDCVRSGEQAAEAVVRQLFPG